MGKNYVHVDLLDYLSYYNNYELKVKILFLQMDV